MDLGAVPLQLTVLEMVEEVLRDSGERLDSCPIETEDVVGPDEVDAVELYVRVLDAVGGGMDQAREVALSLPLGQILRGGRAVSGEGRQAGGGGTGEDAPKPRIVLGLDVKPRFGRWRFVALVGPLDSRVDVLVFDGLIEVVVGGLEQAFSRPPVPRACKACTVRGPSVGSSVLNTRTGVSFHAPMWTASTWAEADASWVCDVAALLWLPLQAIGMANDGSPG
ncbi:hypothetical protein ABT213_26085 [Streptomyces sp. NPDC001674]|uniref:hypothetical protein n=1 Tax=Streptomyces sp. NPDC001674 TaxID=3154394 RepID=UPI0033178180